jgi:hypothetical protein
VIARDGAVDIRLRRFAVPACGTEVLSILVDIAATADIAGEHRLELRGTDAIVAPGARLAFAPASDGGAMRQASARSGRTGVRTVGPAIGTTAVEYLRILKPIRYGPQRTVARMRVTAHTRDDHLLQRVVFTNEGSARAGDLRNFFLQSSRGQRLTRTADHLLGDRVLLSFDPPLLLRRGTTQTFELVADVMSGIRRTIHFVIQEPGDLAARVRRSRSR